MCFGASRKIIARPYVSFISITAAIGQKNMSKKEFERRELTKTLNITSITSALRLLDLTPDYYPNVMDQYGSHTDNTTTPCLAFKVESNSKYFSVPATFKIPMDSDDGKFMILPS